MSTQDAADIPLTTSLHQQAFKLLELPPELLALLESDAPPTLHLKSATPSTPAGIAQALLVTPQKTYRIQQKNSSNPIMILQPSTTSKAKSDNSSEIPRSSVCSIATLQDTLELSVLEEASAPVKVNKWHEKFAKTRNIGKSTS